MTPKRLLKNKTWNRIFSNLLPKADTADSMNSDTNEQWGIKPLSRLKLNELIFPKENQTAGRKQVIGKQKKPQKQ